MSSNFLRYYFCSAVCVLLIGESRVCTKASKTPITSDVNNSREHLANVTTLRRFLLADNPASRWVSWQQHVACLTTCVEGYEEQTLACCTTGDNRLCFDLPWALLNNSIGKCKAICVYGITDWTNNLNLADFCQRKEEISCHMSQFVVCGSDGRIYQNRCEFAKAVCNRKGLVSKEVDLCQSRLSTSPLDSSISSGTVTLKQSLATRKDTTTTKTTFPHSSKSSSMEVALTSRSLRTSETPTTAQLFFTTTLQTSTGISPTVPGYCQNRDSVSCGFSFSIVCGSDKKYYANVCMLALGRCDNPYLTQKDMQYCASGR